MIVLAYAVIAVVIVVLAIGGVMYLDHKFSQTVGDRPFAIKGRNIDTDDPFVRRQYRKFFAMRVAWCVALLVLLILLLKVVSHVG